MGMATILERTVTDEIGDALRHLSDAERYLADARAHLAQALTADPDERRGTVAQARRVANVVAGCVTDARRSIDDAGRRAA